MHALPDDADEPIHFRADNVEGDLLVGGLSSSTADGASADSPAKRVVATGSVQIGQGSMRLTADRVVIESEGDRITLMDARGDPAHYRQQAGPGAGFIEARASNIVYRPADARIELIGRAFLTRDSDEFRGDVITYDIRQGKVVATGEHEGVEMIIQPGSARGYPSQENSP
ncbi:MAG: lipopolysaccharide transport periplasmic protein LptA [Gammaproteobacteria bacterium]|nr:lipopolysaccharide transport periplasmic protein LptA [Gammaproteobacteria bacterium]